MQENRMHRMGTTEDEEEEEEDDKSSEQHFVDTGLICAACHLTVSTTNLRDNNEQALACSQGHLLCHRCVQRFAIKSGKIFISELSKGQLSSTSLWNLIYNFLRDSNANRFNSSLISIKCHQ